MANIIKLKSKKKRSSSSKQWLLRQLNDPFVQKAKQSGYRSRSAFKLIEIHEKYKIFSKDQHILDLGCAPGGWSQIAKGYIGDKGVVIGVDLLEVDPIPGVVIIQGDIEDDEVLNQILNYGLVDVIMSDMAPSSCGISSVDHIRIINLIEITYDLAKKVLKPKGILIAKVLGGGTQHELLMQLRKSFERVVHIKPRSSRQESCEFYVVAIGYRGNTIQPNVMQIK